jgi:cellulose synthase/poly-beta-1,6-N-acetylglucosamine synthase-like glycosyltransferase
VSLRKTDTFYGRKRQFGSEKSTTPLPSVHPHASDGKLIRGRLGIAATIVLWATYVIYTVIREFLDSGSTGFRFTTEALAYLVIVTVLMFSALMYLISRYGAFVRFRHHQRVPRSVLDAHFTEGHSPLTVLVPSYAEEPSVIRATLWSAALQEYPSLRLVLLIDDEPNPADPAVQQRLDQTRAIAGEISKALIEPTRKFREALRFCELGHALDDALHVTPDAVQRLAENYRWAGRWLDAHTDAAAARDHIDKFSADEVFGALADDFTLVAAALDAAVYEDHAPSPERMIELHRRLVWTFTATLDSFERKQFASLSHDANKAMNLNSYIGLMGGNYRREDGPTGSVLVPVADAGVADVVVPDAVYLLTLDADSVLLREYCLRLVYFLEQPENLRVAVTQTPYSSFRGAPTRVERLAGASTDIQHILHQGMSHYGAAFWVGANAVIRKHALEDIVEVETVGGFEVRRYVQDRTVIEDTESSIDLGAHGWTLANYPERLSYSATPPDFGSLIVQRRRWANGGLLILPKFINQVRSRRGTAHPIPFVEVCLRLNYICSIAWANIGLLFLLIYPYDSRLLSPIVLLAALPYFMFMGSDLRYSGYKFSDIFRVYGFNLILLPVNLAGVLKSLQQTVTGRKIPFVRTPKVKNRTSASIVFVLAPHAIVIFSGFTVWRNVEAGNWGNATFAAFNMLITFITVLTTIGIWNSIVDVWLGLTDWLWVDNKRGRTAVEAPAVQVPAVPATAPLDWRSVLYDGEQTDRPHSSGAPTLAGETPDASNEENVAEPSIERELQLRTEGVS